MDFNSDALSHHEESNESVERPANLFDSPYVDGIRFGKREVIDSIYKVFFPKIKSMVLKNSGTPEDARDIFQETLIAIYRNSQKPGFHLTCRFDTYLYAIARNLWFVNLRKRNIHFTDLESLSIPEDLEDLEETINSAERYRLYNRAFAELGEQCRKLLLLYMEGITMKAIAEALGFASESYAKKRKFKCKEKLIARITENDGYKKIMARG
jgi:RNA polymerase sigma factor (sigma-70 family)